MEWQIRQADHGDLGKLEAFLTEAGISSEGVEGSISHFSVMETDAGELKACLGVECAGQAGLLRSFVVSPKMSEQEVMLLFDSAFSAAKINELRELYLVTNKMSAVSFFSRMGFEIVGRLDLPDALLGKSHLKQVVTVDNSAIMKIIL
ncbi:hypothetical protein [Bacillus sp. REN3]|uniref:GNAT family N-acetyltransferase n=1 Tax=Bacillus sp. REN3 TaxID=2802440 RepID=UPI001AEEFD85|nr:hypothetical protein [Bacillus sp. REN3]